MESSKLKKPLWTKHFKHEKQLHLTLPNDPAALHRHNQFQNQKKTYFVTNNVLVNQEVTFDTT